MIIEKKTTVDLVVVKPDSFDPGKLYPLVIHLHGVGGRQGLDAIVNGELPKEIQQAVDRFDFIAVAPHTDSDWTVKDVEDTLLFCKELPINWKKIYLLGTSLGGGGVTKYLSAADTYAATFAAAVTSCGLNWISNAGNIAKWGPPLVMFHAQDDSVVNVSNTNNAVSTINGLQPKYAAKKIIYPSGDHWIWGRVWSPTNRPWLGNETPITIWDWLLTNEVGSGVLVPESVPGPVIVKANAGDDKTLTTGDFKLDGTRSTGYLNGTSCSWQVLEVPQGANQYTIFYKGAGYVTIDARVTVPGRYKFQLTVRGIDAGGKLVTAFDEILVNYEPSGTPVPEFAPTHSIFHKDGSKEDVIIKLI